jgi:multiple sugar transport system permease protein
VVLVLGGAYQSERTRRPLIGRGDLLTLPVAHYRVFELFGLRHWGAINAFTILAVLPIVVSFIIFERHLVKSMVASAVKG